MPRSAERWPIWKIATASAGCAAVAAALFWLSRLAEQLGTPTTTGPSTRTPALTLPSFIMMLALMAAILAVLSAVWLGFRIREARTPAWKRSRKKRRR